MSAVRQKDDLNDVSHELATQLEYVSKSNKGIDSSLSDENTNFKIDPVKARINLRRASRTNTLFLFKGENSILLLLILNMVVVVLSSIISLNYF